MRYGDEVNLVIVLRQRPLAIRADSNIVGRRTLAFLGRLRKPRFPRYFYNRAPVGAVIANGHQTALRVDVDSVRFRTEVRTGRSSRGQNQIRISTLRWNPD